MLGPPKSTRSKARSNQKPMTAEVCIFLKSWDSSLLSEEGQGGQATSIVPDHRHLSHTHSLTFGHLENGFEAFRPSHEDCIRVSFYEPLLCSYDNTKCFRLLPLHLSYGWSRATSIQLYALGGATSTHEYCMCHVCYCLHVC